MRVLTILSMERPRPAKIDRDRSMPRMSESKGGPLGCRPSISGLCQPKSSSMGICSRVSSWRCCCGWTCGTTSWAETKATQAVYARTHVGDKYSIICLVIAVPRRRPDCKRGECAWNDEGRCRRSEFKAIGRDDITEPGIDQSAMGIPFRPFEYSSFTGSLRS